MMKKGVGILCLLYTTLFISSALRADVRSWFGLDTGERHVVFIFDKSESFRNTVIPWSSLNNAELARVVHQSLDNEGIPQFLTKEALVALYDAKTRNCLATNLGHCEVPGPHNDLWSLQGLRTHCMVTGITQADTAPCIRWSQGLDGQSAAKSVVTGLFLGELKQSHILVAVPGNQRRVQFPYDSFSGQKRELDVVYDTLRLLNLTHREYQISLPQILKAVQRRLKRYRDQGKIRTDPGTCDRVHIVMVSDFNLTRQAYHRLSQAMESLRKTLGKSVSFHHVPLIPHAKDTVLTERLSRWGSSYLDWGDLYRSPWGALIASEGRFPYGCSIMRMTPGRIEAGADLPWMAKLVAYALPDAWLGQLFLYEDTALMNLPSVLDDACFDANPKTPCGRVLYPDRAPRFVSQSGNLRAWRQRNLYLSYHDPETGQRVMAHVSKKGELSPQHARALAEILGTEPDLARALVQFYLGDRSVELSQPNGLFRDRCMSKDGRPGVGCSDATSFFEGPLVDYRNLVIQYGAWSRFDDAEMISYSDAFTREPDHRFYLVYSHAQCQVRMVRIERSTRDRFRAREVWTYIPAAFVDSGKLLSYALPRPDAPDCFVFLREFVRGGQGMRRFLIGTHPTRGHRGLFIMDLTDPEKPPTRTLVASLDGRNLPVDPGRVEAYELVDVYGRAHIVLGTGRDVRGPFCVMSIDAETGRFVDVACLDRPDVAMASLFGKDGRVYFALASGTMIETTVHRNGRVTIRTGSLRLRNGNRQYVVAPLRLFQSPGATDQPAALGVVGRLMEVTRGGPRRPSPHSALLVASREALFGKAGGTVVVDALARDSQVTFARLSRKQKFWRAYRQNELCNLCRGWGLVLENALVYRVDKRVGIGTSAFFPVYTRSADCTDPIYSIVLLREAWLMGPAPIDYASTKHPYAYNAALPLGIYGFGFRLPGPAFGMMGPHGGRFKDVIVQFADPERDNRTAVALVPLIVPRGMYREPPVPPRLIKGRKKP